MTADPSPESSAVDSPPPASPSLQHVLAELEWLDVLLRVQAWRVRASHGDDPELAGLYAPDTDPDTLLDRPLGTPPWTAAALDDDVRAAVAAALDRCSARVLACEQDAAVAGTELRLARLATLFGLTRFEVDVVLTCLAPELDRRYERLYGYLHDDVTRRRPSVDLVLALFVPDVVERVAARARFGPDAPLLRFRLVELGDEPEQPAVTLLGCTLRLDPRIAAHLLGDDAPDVRLRAVVTTGDVRATGLPEVPAEAQRQLVALAEHAGTGPPLTVHCRGDDGAVRRSAFAAFGAALHRGVLVVDGARVAEGGRDEVALVAALADREARLRHDLLCWDGLDPLLAEDRHADLAALRGVLAGRDETTLVGGAATWEPVGAAPGARFLRVELPAPGAAERERLWRAALGGAAGPALDGTAVDLPGLAATFRLGAGRIADAAVTARNLALARDPGRPTVSAADLRAAARLHSNRDLGRLASRITPRAAWDDLVLPEDRTEQLRDLADQVRHRGTVLGTWGFGDKLALGTGLAVLFAGPPGTGKTMAADVLAHTLGMDLYKIDLSALVSKYIGETEKNLARIFADAATSNAILFFDEADALFGKRSAVRDAHDRYANVEISYLLQRMESYDGVVVLATNLRKNMDDAFVRRLHATIDFPVPGTADRLRIWRQIWPSATPVAPDVDLDLLARTVEVPGGNIRNIALAGAYLAAADGGVVTMAHLRRATAREFQKMGKLVANGARRDA
ncbi:MAG: hypothetical protein QOK35_263 [Pseudonocardiales bacterium]|nr:hypothetical protein [Pseudonocardiales bacterium]